MSDLAADGRIAGPLLTLEQTRGLEHQRRGADRGHAAPLRDRLAKHLQKGRMGGKMASTGHSTRTRDAVEGRRVHCFERAVRLNPHSMRSAHDPRLEPGCDDFAACPTQDIDDRHRFDFLESGSQRHEDLGSVRGFCAHGAESSYAHPLMSRPPAVPVLVSACLIGRYCRYDGRTNHDRVLEQELEAKGERAVSFCPEQEGGLSTPRAPAWIERESAAAVLDGRDRVVTDGGRDVTREFVQGAERALEVCRAHGIVRAYLKARSPSCGTCRTHVGGTLVEGPGITAAHLQRAGIETIDVEGRRERT